MAYAHGSSVGDEVSKLRRSSRLLLVPTAVNQWSKVRITSSEASRSRANSSQVEETLEQFTARLERNKPAPNNNKLYQRTRQLFKRRRDTTTAYKRKLTETSPPAKAPTPFQPPKFPPSQTLRNPHPSRWSYRPPAQARSESPKKASSTSSTKTRRKAQIRSLAGSRRQVPTSWPPPKDSNYSKVSSLVPRKEPLEPDSPVLVSQDESRPARLKFVKCEKCGKKNLSSLKQLKTHQESKKCKNRQDRQSELRCSVCEVSFDTSHNLRKHVCRRK